MRSRSFAFLAILLCTSAAARAVAADSLWNLPVNGTFNVADNWFGGVPGLFDRARFEITSSDSPTRQRTYSINFTNDPINDQLVVEDDNVTFDLDGHTYTLRNDFVGVALGMVPNRSGNLTVTGGTIRLDAEADLEIAPVVGARGVLTVGAGGFVLGAPNVLVGLNGNGTLNINSGGDLIADDVIIGNQNDSTGTAAITGAGSALVTDDMFVGFGGPGTLTISAGGQVENNDGSVGLANPTNTGTVNVEGANSRWRNANLLSIGVNGRGTLNITAGGRVESAVAELGFFTDSIGNVTVSGTGSQWINSGQITIAVSGVGTLSITAGGLVQNTNGVVGGDNDGTVTVDGVGAQWINSGSLTVGEFGFGTLNITGGGMVQSNSASLGATDSGDSRGEVTVSGASLSGTRSRWINSGPLTVGDRWDGTLNIIAGGKVENTSARIGVSDFNRTGAVTASGAHSEWINSAQLVVGASISTGRLDIMAGGLVQNTNGIVADGHNSAGVVSVDGPGSRWINSAGLEIGRGGQAVLNITGGGKVQNTFAHVGVSDTDAPTNGQVTVSGTDSVWETTGRLSLGDTGVNARATLSIQPGGTVRVIQDIVLFNLGQLHLQGGTLETQAISFQGSGLFDWTSGTLHVGAYTGTLTTPDDGILAPGNSVGKTFIDGHYFQQPRGTLEIEIGGPASADLVDITGVADLSGDLELKLLRGFVPSPASRFVVFDSRGINGAFLNVASGQRLTTTDGLGSFLVSYGSGSPLNSNQIILSSFIPNINGDFDHDGDVDGNDFLFWQRGDSPNNGNLADLTAWRVNFGTSGGAAASIAVPEPSGEWIALAAIWLGLALSGQNQERCWFNRIG